ncbi:hypothetical protein TNCT_300601 [Trichonephila clavata]|uniref:EMI domain-containing protein n=1 Tax=Trichonephila clavata TaxID=2740835 RepID=A0A8X6L6N5_TRICU|nr:hypothetical protein TNCT_300601 [Trichonephila clavata]
MGTSCISLLFVHTAILFASFLYPTSAIELTGPNICSKEEKSNLTLWISYSRPYQIRTTTWCFHVPPRCSTYR